MRCAALLAGLLCLALGACADEPSFDERYAEQEKKLAQEAVKTGHEIDRRMTEKPGMEAPPSAAATPAPANT